MKSKSIFSVSSFGALRQTDIHPLNKKENLKLNVESKRLVLDDVNRKYET